MVQTASDPPTTASIIVGVYEVRYNLAKGFADELFYCCHFVDVCFHLICSLLLFV
jgi:hypothetical protein